MNWGQTCVIIKHGIYNRETYGQVRKQRLYVLRMLFTILILTCSGNRDPIAEGI